ncbi:duplicated homeodomain-like superfamily protein [Actinidia rufa]|uniref:Duplicated homeodomain-like superfamily protein n=1 Tax=Actinidia rufa TaxID=165716 RepID=A0A7J0GVC4_9ERIC|nr:duplicated homeodomain-like superfamily protein [Actinidia rufa]
MPPEPLPWARRDFFKERKRERSFGVHRFVSRWRENPHHGREFLRSRPPGHAKQGGWHNFSEPGHGFTPSRSNEKIFGDENCKPSGSSADGKFSRNSRENRGSFGARRIGEVILGRMVHGKWSWQTDSEDQNNKTGNNGLGTGQILERENSMGSIDRKTLNWTCSGSLTSRGDAVACATSAAPTSAAPSDETNYMKKPRLGWGEGLAKYEKKKVEGPDDSATKNGMVVCVNTEPSHSNGSILSDKSLGFMFSDCASPGTPSSVACRSSPGPSSSQRECQAKPCEDLVVNTGGSLRPAPLQLVSSGDMIAKEATVNAAAWCLNQLNMVGAILIWNASKPSNQEVTCSAYVSNGEKEECLSDCDSGGQLMA